MTSGLRNTEAHGMKRQEEGYFVQSLFRLSVRTFD